MGTFHMGGYECDKKFKFKAIIRKTYILKLTVHYQSNALLKPSDKFLIVYFYK